MTPNVRGAYLSSSVVTASPSRLLVMLCDRLVLDIQRALSAYGEGSSSRDHLLHAQDIVLELQSSLRPDGWSGGPLLASIYTYLYGTLVRANVAHDPDLMQECLTLATQLQETWRDAALAVAEAPRTGASATA